MMELTFQTTGISFHQISGCSAALNTEAFRIFFELGVWKMRNPE